MEVPSRQVVCCKARTWCFVIGYLTLIGSCFPLAIGISGLSSKPEGKIPFLPTSAKTDISTRKTGELTWRVSCLVTGIFGFLMGAFLCAGVHLRIKVYLRIWMGMELLALLVIGFVSFVGIVAGFKTNPIPTFFLLPFLTLVLVITFFPLWVVKYHWDELRT